MATLGVPDVEFPWEKIRQGQQLIECKETILAKA